MTIGKKLIAGFGLVLSLLVVVTAVALYSLNQIQTSYGRFFDVNQGLVDAGGELAFIVRDRVISYRGVMLYPERVAHYLDDLDHSSRRFQTVVQAMQELLATTEERALVDGIVARYQAMEQAQDRVLDLMQRDRREQALALGASEVVSLTEAVLTEVDRFRELQERQIKEGRDTLAVRARLFVITLLIVSAAAVIAGLLIALSLGRAITGPLQDSIARLASSAAEILATTSQVASGASETATAVSETTATVEEVKQTAQAASQKARQVSESAQKVKQVAQTGRGAVEGTVAGMHHIQEQMQSIADGIVRLSEKSREIGEIIATVNDLAEQSNLLAVNAAIEATRAGEQGAGFAVVAQEVKSLAEQSKQATAQVRGILGDIQKATSDAVLATEQGGKAVDAGVKQSAETDAAIRQLADSVNEAAQAASQIAASSQQQIAGMDQVAQAMDNIKQASAQNVAGTRQAETAARDLHELGQRLESLIKPRSVRARPKPARDHG